MKEIKILYLYPDMLNLYGDRGNIQALQYRIEKRGIKATIDHYYLGGQAPDFSAYDIVFAGGGADREQALVSDDMMQYKESIKKAIIMEEMYKQGFKDGMNLIIQCQNK